MHLVRRTFYPGSPFITLGGNVLLMGSRLTNRCCNRTARPCRAATVAICAGLLAVFAAWPVRVAEGNAAEEAEGRTVGRVITIPLPIQGGKSDRILGAIERAVSQMESAGSDRPILIFEFSVGETEQGTGNVYQKASHLAETIARLQGVRTIAYLPSTIKGHAVLVAMACDEIVMHPDAKIGEAGVDETDGPIQADRRDMYTQIANMRKTIPVPLALGMLDPQLTVLEVHVGAGAVEIVFPQGLAELRKKQGLEITRVETLIPEGEMGLIDAAKARDLGFLRLTARDLQQLAQQLDLPADALETTPLTEGAVRPILIDLDDEIDARLAGAVRTMIREQIEQRGKNFICLRIDSPGGSMTESLELARYLAELDPAEVRTVAYIQRGAEAAGAAAVVALACDHLVMHESGMLGGGTLETDEQVVEAAQEAIQAIAQRKSRSWSLAAATINPNLEVHRYRREGRRRVEYFSEAELQTRENPQEWIQGDLITKPDETLRVSGGRAEELALARYVVESDAELKQRYGIEEDLLEVKPGWLQFFSDALVRPEVAAFLLMLGGVALYIELQMPGVGIGGFGASVCYVLFFWSQYLNGTATGLEIVLFVLGVGCLVLEVFVLPGFGIFGLGGGAMIIVSLVLASMTADWFGSSSGIFQLRRSMMVVVGSGVGMVVLALIARRYLPHAPMLNRVLLQWPAGEESQLSRRESMVDYQHLVDQRGVTTTQLTPSGKARIGDQWIDVIADGEVIERGTEIVVVEVHGNRVLVQSAAQPTS